MLNLMNGRPGTWYKRPAETSWWQIIRKRDENSHFTQRPSRSSPVFCTIKFEMAKFQLRRSLLVAVFLLITTSLRTGLYPGSEYLANGISLSLLDDSLVYGNFKQRMWYNYCFMSPLCDLMVPHYLQLPAPQSASPGSTTSAYWTSGCTISTRSSTPPWPSAG